MLYPENASAAEILRNAKDRFHSIQRTYLELEQRPGRIWTGRLEIAGIIQDLDRWANINGFDLEVMEYRDYLISTPHGQYSPQACCQALKDETWNYISKYGSIVDK